MRIKKWMTLVVAFAMAFTVIGFGLATDDVSAATKAPTKITLKSTYKTVDIKGKVTVSVKSVTPSNASKSVTWKSSNTKIATVNSKGVVTGKKAGSVTITATSKKSKNVKATIKITVKQLSPKVSLPSSVTVYTGVSKTVKATMPSNIYNAGIVYKCSTKLATISPSGKATTGSVTIKNKTPIKTKGYFVLTAYSKENSKIKDTCRVYVYRSIAGLTFDESDVEIASGDTYTQTAKIKAVTPKSYCKTIVYSSSNKNVATVDSKGVVTAVAPGTATITAKAKYGYAATAKYKVTVYDVLEPDNGVYTIDKTKYSSYEISATRNGKTERVLLSNADVENIIGKGNLGFDWMKAVDVKDNFGKTDFSYTSGGDYIFKKEGNAVTIKALNQPTVTMYYNAEKSIVVNGDDYTITLFANEDGTGKSVTLYKTGNTVTGSAQGYSFKMVCTDRDTTVTISSESKSVTATFTRVEGTDGNVYAITLNPGNIEANKVVVKAYK